MTCPVVNFAKNFTSGYNIVMKFIKQNFYKLLVITLMLIIPVISFAQTNPPAPPTKVYNPLGKDISIPNLIKKILDGALTIGIPIIALAIIYCGFLFVFARGNPEKLTKAKDALLWTLVGTAILLGSWTIAHMINTTVTQLGK